MMMTTVIDGTGRDDVEDDTVVTSPAAVAAVKEPPIFNVHSHQAHELISPMASPFKRERLLRDPGAIHVTTTSPFPLHDWSLDEDEFGIVSKLPKSVACSIPRLSSLSRESSWVIASPPVSRTTASSLAVTPAGMRLAPSCATDLCEDDLQEDDKLDGDHLDVYHMEQHELPANSIAGQMLDWDLVSP